MLQPIQLISCNIEVAKAGKVPAGKTEIPFEFPLNTKGNKTLYETYHGVFVNIQVSEGHRKGQYDFTHLTLKRIYYMYTKTLTYIKHTFT